VKKAKQPSSNIAVADLHEQSAAPDALLKDRERVKKLNDDLAQSSWKVQRDAVTASMGHAIQFGVAALAAPITVNGAALAAMLGFASANSTRLAAVLDQLDRAFISFAIGFVSAALATGAAYSAQFCYTYALGRYSTSLNHPYVVLHPTRWHRLGISLHIAAVVLIIISYGGLIAGIVMFNPVLRQVAEQAGTAVKTDKICVIEIRGKSVSVPCNR
jgi:hypothetical protein